MGVCMNIRSVFLSIFVFVVSVVFLPGCFRRVHVTSNAFADAKSLQTGFAVGSKFVIICTNKENPLLNQDVITKISKHLEKQGYCIASNIDSADYCFVFNFDITSERKTDYIPVNIPGQSQTTHGNIYGRRDSVQYNQTTQSSGTTAYLPQEYVLFTRSLHAYVYEAETFKKDQQEVFVWQGSAVSCGDSADFRAISDYLLVAIFKSFGKDTKKMINNSFAEKDLKSFWDGDKKSEALKKKHGSKTKKRGKQSA